MFPQKGKKLSIHCVILLTFRFIFFGFQHSLPLLQQWLVKNVTNKLQSLETKPQKSLIFYFLLINVRHIAKWEWNVKSIYSWKIYWLNFLNPILKAVIGLSENSVYLKNCSFYGNRFNILNFRSCYLALLWQVEGAMKMFMHYSCLVIILFITDIHVLTSFKKLVFCLFCFEFDVIFRLLITFVWLFIKITIMET